MIHYLITSTRRAGTRYLCSMLQGLKIGNPKEITLYEYPHLNSIEKIYESGAAKGVWGGVLHRCHYKEVLKRLRVLSDIKGIDDYTTLFKIFPNIKFIYLHRIDKVAQAVSLEKALQLEEWWIVNQSGNQAKNVRFNETRIREHIANFYLADSEWCGFFRHNGIIPLHISYEELEETPVLQLKKICDFLDVEIPSKIDCVINRPAMPQKQFNHVNSNWINRFLERNSVDQYIPFQNKRR
ncbi:MAG: Stf0 family sulfotransferase [Candidatus Poribacteria bacterium]|nr:Stf0 family sulfotransferase [Candidatus Poribacteria bacterium]